MRSNCREAWNQMGRKTAVISVCLFAAALTIGFLFRALLVGEERTDGAVNHSVVEVTVYFVSDAGDSYFLQPVKRRVDGGLDLVGAALRELIRGPDCEENLLPVIPPGVCITDLVTEGGVCRVSLSREYILNAPAIGACPALERLSLAAIADTLTEIEGIRAVVLSVEGLQRGLLEGRHVEDLWGYFGLPQVLARDETLIGPPGLSKKMRASVPAWKRVDKEALAAALGWGEITRGDPGIRRVALTFDAGASGLPTPAILDILKEAGVHATFFLTGQFADTYPDLVRRMAEEGHELANHSYHHPRFTEIEPGRVVEEIIRTEERIKELTGLSTRPYFRFPYGARNSGLVEQINSLGYLSVYWTVDTLDWMDSATGETIRERVARNAVPGAIILMHCGSQQEAQALSLVIEDLRKMGLEPVTLSELLSGVLSPGEGRPR